MKTRAPRSDRGPTARPPWNPGIWGGGNWARIWGDERVARAHLLSPPSETVGSRFCGLPRFFCGGTGAASPVFSSRSVPIQSCVGVLPRAGIFPSKAVSETFGADPIGGTGAVFGWPRDSRRGVAASPCASFGEIARDGGCLASAYTPRRLAVGLIAKRPQLWVPCGPST